MQPAHWLAASAKSPGITSALFRSIYMVYVVICGTKKESAVTLCRSGRKAKAFSFPRIPGMAEFVASFAL